MELLHVHRGQKDAGLIANLLELHLEVVEQCLAVCSQCLPFVGRTWGMMTLDYILQEQLFSWNLIS